MKVLIVNVNGATGSTGNIVNGLYHYLESRGHQTLVCYRGVGEEKIDNPNFIELSSSLQLQASVLLARMTGLESHFSPIATRKLKGIIEDYKPDVVQLYNLHGNYINSYEILRYLKAKAIPTVYSMVDEFPYMGKCPYPVECEKFKTECSGCPQKKTYPQSWFIDQSKRLFNEKQNIYNNFKDIVFTGPPYVCRRAKSSKLLAGQNIVELDEPFDFETAFYPSDTKELQKSLGILNEDRVIISAPGTSPRKGGQDFLAVADMLKDEPNIKFIFIGYDRNDWVFPKNVIVKGFIKSAKELAQYMSLADLYVCTSVGDTTPSVCLGAIGCGTPLAGFDYGGVKDTAPNEFGHWVEYGNLQALSEVVKNTTKKSQNQIQRIRDYAVGRFSKDVIYKKQLEIYNEIIK